MPQPDNNPELFEAFEKFFQLERYPFKHNSELRAWDAADVYLLNTLEKLNIELNNIVILNDNFGALTLPLLSHSPLVYNDSWLAREALFQNIKRNQLSESLTFFSSIESLKEQPIIGKMIIGRAPKAKSQLAFLLQNLQKLAPANSLLLLAGMDKHLSKGQYDLLEKYFGPSRFYPGVKKARIWEARLDKSIESKDISALNVHVPEFDLSLSNNANVFSQEKLDIGTRFFLENMPKLPKKDCVADLACGNGILGLSYLKLHPEASMLFSDESFQAIESCKENCLNNLPDCQVNIRADDGLKQCKPSELELILCNPPFHHQHTVGIDIAVSMFKDAFRALKKGGEFWIVANRHLAYHVTLKKLFGNCSVEASNKKFVILKALKYR